MFGQRVEPGQLVHADKHGFIAIPKGWFELSRLMHADKHGLIVIPKGQP